MQQIRMGETPLIIAVQQREVDGRQAAARATAPIRTRSDAAAGYSARDYAKRDTRRQRDILAAIEVGQQARSASQAG